MNNLVQNIMKFENDVLQLTREILFAAKIKLNLKLCKGFYLKKEIKSIIF